MYVDVELISNNTYQNSTFTYRVPNKIKDKINVGSIVIVPFRNKDYKAIIVSTSNESIIESLKIQRVDADYWKNIRIATMGRLSEIGAVNWTIESGLSKYQSHKPVKKVKITK